MSWAGPSLMETSVIIIPLAGMELFTVSILGTTELDNVMVDFTWNFVRGCLPPFAQVERKWVHVRIFSIPSNVAMYTTTMPTQLDTSYILAEMITYKDYTFTVLITITVDIFCRNCGSNCLCLLCQHVRPPVIVAQYHVTLQNGFSWPP